MFFCVLCIQSEATKKKVTYLSFLHKNLPVYIFAHFINLLLKRAVKLILKKSSANGKGPGSNGFYLR